VWKKNIAGDTMRRQNKSTGKLEKRINVDNALKKQVLRTFTYGMYIVSCVDEDGTTVNAFTANWLTQVSFEPPLIAVSIENISRSLPMIQRTRKFNINVLRSGDRKLAGDMGKSGLKYPEKMAGVGYSLGSNGVPIINQALAWVACDVRNMVDAGDSTLVVGEVLDIGMLQEGQPLTMSEAGFKHAG
jgi:flavin reductase (DIM6/NTAB) family NADH-FMN oxidoreductase RutF